MPSIVENSLKRRFFETITYVTSKLRMHGTERVNAIGTELLDRFGRVQAPDHKGAVRKYRRKSRGTLLRSESS